MMWIRGDLHVHSSCCWDASISVSEIVRRSKKYCDFIAISGHAKGSDDWGREQHAAILEARREFPDFPIFHSAEVEFPIPRHVMFITAPENHEFELQKELTRQFDREKGNHGVERAMEELEYVKRNWGDDTFMLFNHPNSPAVPYEALEELSKSPVFRLLACYDRGERVAPQTWDIGGAWDQLLCAGRRIFTRFGSDFHRHFTDGGDDYYPGEFACDHLLVESCSYHEIISAYMEGRFYSTAGDPISEPDFTLNGDALHLSFKVHSPLEKVEIISDGQSVMVFENIDSDFNFEGVLPFGKYYRVRGTGVPKKRFHSEGEFKPAFTLNPVWRKES